MNRLMLMGAVCGLVFGCGGVPSDGEALQDSEVPDTQQEDLAQVESAVCGDCGDCVLHARCLAPKLPHGLFTWSDKVAIINSSTAHKGCVAIIPSSNPAGHVAYVSSVSGSTIHLNEANWTHGACTTRSGTKASLNIRGFWCP